MFITKSGEVITDDESDGEVEDDMPSLVEGSEEELEAEGQSLVARRALSAQAKSWWCRTTKREHFQYEVLGER